MEQTARKRNPVMMPAVVLAAVIVLMLGARAVFSGPDDGIEFDTDYPLAYTYLTKIEGSGEQARVFDFTDRSLPEPSKLVPLRDSRGIPLVRQDPNVPEGHVRKVRVRVEPRTVEGTTYPGYEVVEWRFRMGQVEEQRFIPTMKPR